MSDSRPRIGITMGDPTGVGPEIIVQALSECSAHEACLSLVIGRAAILEQAARLVKRDILITPIDSIEQAEEIWRSTSNQPHPSILCLQVGDPRIEQVIAPKSAIQVDALGGQAAYDSLVAATELCRDHRLDAIVTAPLHKVALHRAGHDWPGHTELLAHLCGVPDSSMMLYLPPGKPRHGGRMGLGVVHVTLHCALRDVFSQLTIESILETIALADGFFRRLSSAMELNEVPRIAVAALNPHGGESGRFGDEEMTIIAPAVERARANGIDVVGPLPVDTLMSAAADGRYDAVVAMYHDQGHIALKLLDMFEAVNITLGLPILRTSVAHGTGHDIAWQGIAEWGGMTQAIMVAAQLVKGGAADTLCRPLASARHPGVVDHI